MASNGGRLLASTAIFTVAAVATMPETDTASRAGPVSAGLTIAVSQAFAAQQREEGQGDAGEDGDREVAPRSGESRPETLQITYKPPARGIPDDRVGAGTKAQAIDNAAVRLLAPTDHIAMSLSTQPVLYWRLDSPVDGELTFRIHDAAGDTVVYETALQPGTPGDRASVDTGERGVRLDPGGAYCWSVDYWPTTSKSLEPREVRSCFTVANKAESGRDPGCAPSSVRDLAQSGFWYDALHCAVRHEETAGDGGPLASLLTQLGG